MVNLRSPAVPGVTRPDPRPDPRPAGRPVVERIACWSARHRAWVVGLWLLFLGVAILAGQLLGSQARPQYAPGQAGQADRILYNLGVVTPPVESVLIQARGPGARGATFTTDPYLRQAAQQVVSALERLPRAATDIASPLRPGGRLLVSPDGRSAMVTFQVAGPNATADTTVAADVAAVAAVQARHPGLMVAEAGDASTDAVANTLMSSDFRRAEMTSCRSPWSCCWRCSAR